MIFFDRWPAEESAQISRIDFFRQSRRRQTIQPKRMFEKSWQIKTHSTLTRVLPSCFRRAAKEAWHSHNNRHSDSPVAAGHLIEIGSIGIAIFRNTAKEIFSAIDRRAVSIQIGNSSGCKKIRSTETTIYLGFLFPINCDV